MKILICYASSEGQTLKICRFCADQLFALGHSIELLRAADAGGLEMPSFDAAILAGSVHIGKLQPELKQFAADHAGVLNFIPTLFLQVSLAAAADEAEELADLDRIAEEFCDSAKWKPGAVHQLAGAFKFTQYDFFRTWAMRYIASKTDKDINTQSDTEYTDWASLEALLKSWSCDLNQGSDK